MIRMTHKVGTITLGVTMVAIGVLYLAQIFFGVAEYGWICKLWPVIFILLGVEILLANARKNGEFIYDKTGIVLTFVLTVFAFVLAAVQQAVEISVRYGWRM
jgi:NADH:ubiquinone oxidoreductase subunit K